MTELNSVVRAITFPVASVVGAEWKDFMAALHQCWRKSTDLANWAITQSALIDRPRRDAAGKIEPLPYFDLYTLGMTNRAFWDSSAWQGSKGVAATVIRRAAKIYAKARLRIWNGEQSLPTFRYPHPYLLRAADWAPLLVNNQSPAIKFNAAGRPWVVRLKGGNEFRRQLAGFRQIMDGVKRCEAAVFRKGREKHVMVKLVAHLPKRESEHVALIIVKTDPQAFLVAECDGRPWILNGDHVRRWVNAHRVFLQRIGEDTKHEKRWPAKMRRNINEARQLRCQKHHDRIDTWLHQATAMLVNWCTRQRAANVVYDDDCRDFLPSFPWHDLKTKLAYKLEAAGITLTTAAERLVPCGTTTM